MEYLVKQPLLIGQLRNIIQQGVLMKHQVLIVQHDDFNSDISKDFNVISMPFDANALYQKLGIPHDVSLNGVSL